MNVLDIFYILGRPLAYLSGILGIRKIIQKKSTKSFSILAWSIGTTIVLATFLRSLFSLHDFLFYINAGIGLLMAFAEMFLILKWRHQ